MRRIVPLLPAAALLLAACGTTSTGAAPGTPTSPAPSSTSASTTTSAPAVSTETATSTAPSDSAPSPTATETKGPNLETPPGQIVPLTQDSQPVKVKNMTMVPYVAASLGPGWTQTVRDRDGVDQWQQQATGCQLTSANNISSREGSDRSATESYLTGSRQALLSKTKQPTVAPLAPVALSRAGGRPLQLGTLRVDYTRADTGQRYTTFLAARDLVKEGALLAINLSCPTARASADPQLFTKILTSMRITDAAHR